MPQKLFQLKICLAVTLVVSCLPYISAQAQPASNSRVSSELQFRLNQKTSWMFPGNPLSDVLDFCENLYDIKFIVDGKSLAKNGIRIGQVVQTSGEGTVSEMLTRLLLPIDLEWSAEGNSIFIRAQDLNKRKIQEKRASQLLKQKLSEICRYETLGNSLETVIEELSKLHQVQILVDTVSLESAGMTTETVIKGEGFTTLRHALNNLLSPSNLTWTANRDRVLIRAIPKDAEKLSDE